MNVTGRKAHVTQRIPELEQRTLEPESLINNLRINIMEDAISLLVTDESAEDEAKACLSNGDEAPDTVPV